VNLVAPGECFHIRFLCDRLLTQSGATDTPLAEAIIDGAPKDDPTVAVGRAQTASIPKGKMAYATDIADTIIFLLSDWSSFMTGQCLPVNGGNS
jgi:NAD(P)-dependent dehydrogenase (short-subunit alcohol dehydrogenase family)